MPTIPYVKNPTWADGSGGGTAIDAADLNKVENGIFEVSYAPAVRVTHNAAQAILTATITALAFNTERFDQAGNVADTMHDTVTNNSRLTCRYAGIYFIFGNIEWSASPVNGLIQIRHQGVTTIARNHVIGDYRSANVSCIYALAVNEFVDLAVQQISGGTINVNSSGNYSPEFGMVRVG